jgi:hypothetical protein
LEQMFVDGWMLLLLCKKVVQSKRLVIQYHASGRVGP